MSAAILLVLLGLAVWLIRRAALRKSTQTGGDTRERHRAQDPEDVNYLATLRRKARQITDAAPAPVNGLGYFNFPVYTVKGKKKTTNRMNTRRYRTWDQEQARNLALREGLTDPLEISIESFQPATGSNEYGIRIPSGASAEDETELIRSVLAHDDLPIPSAFMSYATACGVPLSWLSGRGHAADAVWEALDDQLRVELYGYAVDCALQGILPGNILDAAERWKYETFAKAAMENAEICAAILRRPGSDIWKPNKNAHAYRYAAAYFS